MGYSEQLSALFWGLDVLKKFLLAVQFTLALGGLVALKETSPYYAHVVFSWWSVTCFLGCISLIAPIGHLAFLKDSDYFDLVTGVLLLMASAGYFMGYYEKGDADGEAVPERRHPRTPRTPRTPRASEIALLQTEESV